MFSKMPSQPGGYGIQVSAPVVDGSTRNDCGGVPTCIKNDDQLPSSPSQLHDGVTANGAGTVVDVDTLIVATKNSL
jgi:hypothetical protein